MVRGKVIETEELPAYCAVAMAGLDDLPDTIMSRSIVVRMRRRAPDETVEPWRRRVNGPEGEEIAARLSNWAEASVPGQPTPGRRCPVASKTATPTCGRRCWPSPIWPAGTGRDRSCSGCNGCNGFQAGTPPSIGVMLLRDLRAVFNNQGLSHLSTRPVRGRLGSGPIPRSRRGRPGRLHQRRYIRYNRYARG